MCAVLPPRAALFHHCFCYYYFYYPPHRLSSPLRLPRKALFDNFLIFHTEASENPEGLEVMLKHEARLRGVRCQRASTLNSTPNPNPTKVV